MPHQKISRLRRPATAMSGMPLRAPCKQDFHAVHSSGRRPTSIIKLVVLHSEEATTAKSAASWFADERSAGSAHLCVDDLTCYRTLPDDEIPWAAPGANTIGFHIEQAGFARWGSIEWLRHRDTILRAAYKAAVACKRYDIPVQFLWADDLKAGKSGITTHAQCTKAFGGTHTDPGLFYPRRFFMRRCRQYSDELKGVR